jgi:hypothetical protein
MPPYYLTISVFYKNDENNINEENYINVLSYLENLYVKLIEEHGLFTFLKSNCYCKYIIWNIKTESSNIINLENLNAKMKKFTTNNLFLLDIEKLTLRQTLLSKDDMILELNSKCLYMIYSRSKSSDISWRFITVHTNTNDNELIMYFLSSINNTLIMSSTILGTLEEANNYETDIGKFEMEFNNIMLKLSSKISTSDVFNNIEELEPKIWTYIKDNSTFCEKVDYINNIVNNEKLIERNKRIIDLIKKDEDMTLFKEIDFTLSGWLENLNSRVSLLSKRATHLNEEFNSIKSAIATRIQISLEKQNILIQNTLGYLQITAIMVFLFEIAKYFYPFTNDINHILIYILVFVSPIIVWYKIFRKIMPNNNE